MGKRNQLLEWLVLISLLLLLFVSRTHNLIVLPLHNDEGLHLTRATAVWNLHPFWDITDGKIINHWFIAAFYPQNAPDFIARYPNVLFAVLGMAAGYALLRHLFGVAAAVMGCVMWLTAPYLYFFERIAQSDSQAGALIVIMLWACLLLTERSTPRWALLTGAALSFATLMKFTAAPYAIVVLLMILFAGEMRWRLRHLLLIFVVGLLAFAVPLLYLQLRGAPMFNIALGWISSGDSSGSWYANLRNFTAQMTGIGQFAVVWALLVVVGWVGFLTSQWRRLLLFSLVPLALMIGLSTTIFPRHFVVTLPTLLLLAGAGWTLLLQRIPNKQIRYTIGGIVVALLSINGMLFASVATTAPANLNVTRLVQLEYITAHSSGFGLREAMVELPDTITTDDAARIASMFPGSCRRANFYAADNYQFSCVDAPGTDVIQGELAAGSGLYVLVEESPGIGLDVALLAADVQLIKRYPRPGNQTAVVLYYIRPF